MCIPPSHIIIFVNCWYNINLFNLQFCQSHTYAWTVLTLRLNCTWYKWNKRWPLLARCWGSVADAGPASSQHWLSFLTGALYGCSGQQWSGESASGCDALMARTWIEVREMTVLKGIPHRIGRVPGSKRHETQFSPHEMPFDLHGMK